MNCRELCVIYGLKPVWLCEIISDEWPIGAHTIWLVF